MVRDLNRVNPINRCPSDSCCRTVNFITILHHLNDSNCTALPSTLCLTIFIANLFHVDTKFVRLFESNKWLIFLGGLIACAFGLGVDPDNNRKVELLLLFPLR